MSGHAAYVQRESAISIVINGGLSLVFFLLIFGRLDPVPIAGLGHYAFDFLPQSFMIGLMATLVPGLLTRAKLRKGLLAPAPGRTLLPASLPARVGIVALGSLLAGGLVGGAWLMLGGASLGWWAALSFKIAYGALLALVVTPPGLRAALRAGAPSASADLPEGVSR